MRRILSAFLVVIGLVAAGLAWAQSLPQVAPEQAGFSADRLARRHVPRRKGAGSRGAETARRQQDGLGRPAICRIRLGQTRSLQGCGAQEGACVGEEIRRPNASEEEKEEMIQRRRNAGLILRPLLFNIFAK